MTATITFRGGSLRLQHRPLRAATPGRTVSNNRCVAYLKDDDQGRPAPVVAENQLAALKQMSKVVADSGDIELVKRYRPHDCTTNPTLLLKAITMPQYRHFLDEAVAAQPHVSSSTVPLIADLLAVKFGTELLRVVPGRVSSEVDARLSYTTQATVDKALHIMELYAKQGIDPSRVYIKMASSWQGIRACESLEKQGINCNMTLLFSFAQAAACADAGASLISPFVGRIMDWYKAREGRDFLPEEDPGVLSVKTIYAYFKRYGYATTIMAASFRNVGEIRELAGCDAITIAPALLQQLEDSTGPLPYALWPGLAATCEAPQLRFDRYAERLFDELHGADAMAVDKLREGVAGFTADQEKLEKLIADAVL